MSQISLITPPPEVRFPVSTEKMNLLSKRGSSAAALGHKPRKTTQTELDSSNVAGRRHDHGLVWSGSDVILQGGGVCVS